MSRKFLIPLAAAAFLAAPAFAPGAMTGFSDSAQAQKPHKAVTKKPAALDESLITQLQPLQELSPRRKSKKTTRKVAP